MYPDSLSMLMVHVETRLYFIFLPRTLLTFLRKRERERESLAVNCIIQYWSTICQSLLSVPRSPNPFSINSLARRGYVSGWVITHERVIERGGKAADTSQSGRESTSNGES